MEGFVPIRITVYDKGYTRKGVVAAPSGVNVLQVWNAVGETTFTLDASHPRVNDLVTPGSRCVVEYQADESSPPIVLMSGPVAATKGAGSVDDKTREFRVVDDLDELNRIVGYPVPGSGLGSQSGAEYDTRTGLLGNVIKGFVSANVTGQGIPNLTVAANAGDGPSQTVKVRMASLGEKLLPLATAKGLGVRIVQTGTTRELQTWVPSTFARVLTEESGIVQTAEFSLLPPEVTRVVVGIGGEGTARQFYGPPTSGYADSAAEALWGLRRQEFIDARDIDTADANKATLALERATERLEEGKAKASLKGELTETGTFRYGVGYALGGLVSILPAGANAPITERIREVEFEWDEDGLTITPRVGEWQESTDAAHWKTTRALLRRVNDLGAR